MTEAVLTRLRDFSSKTDFFQGYRPGGQAGRGEAGPREADPGGPQRRPREGPSEQGRGEGGEGPGSLDIESALAWLRWELMEMRSQDQVLIRQLMELHAGIQELKLELSEESHNSDEDEDDDDDDEDDDEDDGDESDEHCSWDSCGESEGGSLNSGETKFSDSCLKTTMSVPRSTPPYWLRAAANKVSSRRSSMP